MSMRRSSPPRSNSNDRSHVGWKLRERYLRRNHQGVPTALYNHPEDTSSVRSTRSADETGPLGRSARRFRSRGFSNNNNNNNERTTTSSSSSSLGGRRGIPNRTRSLGNRGGGGIGGLDSSSVHSSSSRSSARSRYSVRSAGQRLGGGGGTIDPNLPPAFRVAHRIEQQRRRVKAQRDDVSCLGSVASHCSTTANSTASGWDDSDDDDDDDDSSIDSADSFGAFGSDDDDDGDAARESRTQLAKANHEVQQQGSNRRRSDTLKKASRFPRMNNTRGALGIPLDLIIEENGSNHKG
eukprot:CAMPEP_0197178224 /NCGR_PEP_ID=MMETSP1423-20130617/3581_1 /TAXON_ID=476441 /ORGANISM="Pseudo-nitzschia heimii, Strain UNC1101" /LENGTH=294 /DNA_ID=CAMNT_0042627931 /DNA_START=717 /DNA_END=1601 /DNA_ORIENTATION=+